MKTHIQRLSQWRPTWLASWLARWLVLGLALCFYNASAIAAGPGKAQPAQPTPSEVLDNAVKSWAAQLRKVAADQIEISPMDPRVKVRACDKALLMDLPFASPETVRVRCSRPDWQLFVRVSGNAKSQTPVTQAPSQAQSQVQSQVQRPPEKPPEAVQRWVLVASVPLQRGMTLNESHVQRAQVDTVGMPVNVLEQASEVLYAEVVRDVRPGVPLRSHDIRPAVLVKRGQIVLLSVGQTQGFQISARVEAMQDGRWGEQIKLKNRDSGRELSGRVQGPNQVVGL